MLAGAARGGTGSKGGGGPVTSLVSLPLQLMKAAVLAESYAIHLSSACLVSCDVYGQ